MALIRYWLLLALMVITLTFLQSYAAILLNKEAYSNLSSACLSCSVETDLLWTSLFLCLIMAMPLIFLSHKMKLPRLLIMVGLMMFWFFIDYSTFDERVFSWSTFSLPEGVFYTIGYAFFPILIGGGIFYTIDRFISPPKQSV